MSFHLFLIAVVSALAVMIPGIAILVFLRGIKNPVLRKLTVILAAFGILHGFYHLLPLVGLPLLANPVDLVTALILILLGSYYSVKAR